MTHLFYVLASFCKSLYLKRKITIIANALDSRTNSATEVITFSGATQIQLRFRVDGAAATVLGKRVDTQMVFER